MTKYFFGEREYLVFPYSAILTSHFVSFWSIERPLTGHSVKNFREILLDRSTVSAFRENFGSTAIIFTNGGSMLTRLWFFVKSPTFGENIWLNSPISSSDQAPFGLTIFAQPFWVNFLREISLRFSHKSGWSLEKTHKIKLNLRSV